MKKFNLLSILFALTLANNATANTMTNTLCAPTEIKADGSESEQSSRGV